MAKHHFTLQRFDQVYELSQTLAQFFPKPEDVHTGIYELLFNALEHGNLGIGYETKTSLLKENRWEEELYARLAHPHNRDKVVSITVETSTQGCTLTISDQGNGFDWRTYLYTQPVTAPVRHGRGLSIVRQSGIPLTFNERGNQITLVASH